MVEAKSGEKNANMLPADLNYSTAPFGNRGLGLPASSMP
jgi:hypothetical protein